MVHEAATRPFRSLAHTRLLDGTPVGLPTAAEANLLLEEVGFERLVTFNPDGTTTELSTPNATQEGADEASAQATREKTPGVLQLPRILTHALLDLVENDKARSPEAGDSPFYEAQREIDVAVGEERDVLHVTIPLGVELYITSVGTDALDAVDQIEVSIDGDVQYRKLFSPMTLSEARSGRCFDPPFVARKSAKVKVKNNGNAPRDIVANLRGWMRPLVRGTVGDKIARPRM